MSGTEKQTGRLGPYIDEIEGGEPWPAIDSHFRLIVVAAQRSKQLLRGSSARIQPDATKRRNTSIAIEEVKRGLVRFTIHDRPGRPMQEEESE
jgi:DNA-directed RNA polymerase omega subunit